MAQTAVTLGTNNAPWRVEAQKRIEQLANVEAIAKTAKAKIY